MNRICQLFCSLTLLLVVCAPAMAQHSGPYVGGFAGGNLLTFTKATDTLGSFNIESDPALQYSGVLGWDLAPGNPVGEGRLELEYSRRSNQVKKVKFLEGNFAGDGKLIAESLMLNTFAMMRDRSNWSPYAGVGVGAARMETSGLQVAGQPIVSGTSTVFAYQLGLGIDYTLTKYLSADLGYRFFGTLRPKFTEANGQSLKMDYFSHSAMLGLRFGF